MTKRQNGDGSIYQRKDGRWVGCIHVRTSAQTVERRYLYGPNEMPCKPSWMNCTVRSTAA
jgi:hypothetical protein